MTPTDLYSVTYNRFGKVCFGLTPLIVTPYGFSMETPVTTTKRPSTRQLLEKSNIPCLYRHSLNSTYYGIKKIGGKRKEHSLGTDDRKIAERRLKDWLAE